MALTQNYLIDVARRVLGELDESVDDSQLHALTNDPQVQLVLSESAKVIKRRHDVLAGKVVAESRLKLIGLANLPQQIVYLHDGWPIIDFYEFELDKSEPTENLIDKLAPSYGTEEHPLEACTLRVHELLTPFAGRNLMEELGGRETVVMDQIKMWAMLLQQKGGQAGYLHVDGSINHFFVEFDGELLDIEWSWYQVRKRDHGRTTSGWSGQYLGYSNNRDFRPGIRVVTN
jgi:hypothetical protein